MKIFPVFKSLLEGRWVNGIHLDDDQILAITTSDFRGWERYYYNYKINKFIPVIQMGSYDINDFDCKKSDMNLAKKKAIEQDLNSKIIELGKVRAK